MEKTLELLTKKIRTAKTNARIADVVRYSFEKANLLQAKDCYNDALTEYENLLYYLQNIDQGIDVSSDVMLIVRMISECLLSCGDHESALKRGKEYLQISIKLEDEVEEQRALITIGRILLCKAEELHYKEIYEDAISYFHKSLAKCDALEARSVITPQLEADMKSGIYLNISLAYEGLKDFSNALVFSQKGIVESQRYDNDQLCRLHYQYATVNLSIGKYDESVKSAKQAISLAKQINNEADFIDDCLKLLTKVCLRRDDLLVAKQYLHQRYKLCNKRSCRQQKEGILKDIKNLRTIIALKNSERNLPELEKIADLYSSLEAYSLSISFYEDCLFLIDSTINPDHYSSILSSIAMCHIDNGAFDKALLFFTQELSILSPTNLLDVYKCRVNISHCYSSLNIDFEKAHQNLLLALDVANELKSVSKIKSCLQNLKNLCNQFNENCLAEKYQERFSSKFTSSAESSEEDSMEEICSQSLHSEGILSSDSDIEKERATSRKKQQSKFRKVNDKGETALQAACIEGNLLKVKHLVTAGHPVNVHDYSGWTPLHEAANQDFAELAEFLLENGANVNDPGTLKSDLLTPLHDACSSGCLDTIDVLLKHGADITAKDKFGNFPLNHFNTFLQNSDVDRNIVAPLIPKLTPDISVANPDELRRCSKGDGKALYSSLSPEVSNTEDSKEIPLNNNGLSFADQCTDSTCDYWDIPVKTASRKRRKLTSKRPSPDPFSADELFVESPSVELPPSPLKPENTQSFNKIFFIDVRFEELLLRIPVSDVSESIGWLCKEAASRYAMVHSKEPEITLLNNHCLLSTNDAIGAVLTSGDTLDAHIISWKTVPLDCIYRNICESLRLRPNKRVTKVLSCDSTTCDLNNVNYLDEPSIKAALQAIGNWNCLKCLNLSSFGINDKTFLQLLDIIFNLKMLSDLNIENNLITASGMSQIKSLALGKTFHPLSALNVSYNSLEDSSFDGFDILITAFRHLEVLNISMCRFSKIPVSFLSNLKKLLTLDVSFNTLPISTLAEIQLRLPSLTTLIMNNCFDDELHTIGASQAYLESTSKLENIAISSEVSNFESLSNIVISCNNVKNLTLLLTNGTEFTSIMSFCEKIQQKSITLNYLCLSVLFESFSQVYDLLKHIGKLHWEVFLIGKCRLYFFNDNLRCSAKDLAKENNYDFIEIL